MKQLILSSAIGLSALVSLQASAFESELSVGAGYVEASDSSDEVELDFLGLSGTLYTAPVDTAKGPLSEAAFLSKATSISLSYAGADSSDVDVDVTSWTGGWKWVTSEKNYILDIQYGYTEVDGDGERVEEEIISLGLGFYYDNTSTFLIRVSQISDEDTDIADSVGLEYQTLMLDNSLRVNAGILRTTLDDSLSGNDSVGATIGATYYPSKTLGFGLSYAVDVIALDGVTSGAVSIDDVDSDIFGIKAEWFVREDIKVSAEYLIGEVETVDIDGLSINATFRF